MRNIHLMGLGKAVSCWGRVRYWESKATVLSVHVRAWRVKKKVVGSAHLWPVPVSNRWREPLLGVRQCGLTCRCEERRWAHVGLTPYVFITCVSHYLFFSPLFLPSRLPDAH